MLVYIATNKINNKKYIGYTTKSLKSRIKSHVKNAYNKSSKHYYYYFQRAIRKYSIDNFEWAVLCLCSSKLECNEKEIEFIKIYNTVAPNGYNLTYGGDGGSPSEITKMKISNSVKNHISLNKDKYNRMITMTPESRSNASKKAWDTKRNNGFKYPVGFKRSEESKLKMSITKNNKGKIGWINAFSGDIIYKSLTEMSILTGLTVGVFNHINKGRQKQSKCGWMLYNN